MIVQGSGQRTSVGNIGWPHDLANLVHILQIRGETAVHGENLFVDDGSNGETVEAIRKSFPELDVVSPLACKKLKEESSRHDSGECAETRQRSVPNRKPLA